jgi:probable HAF family extracellular repeat protein
MRTRFSLFRSALGRGKFWMLVATLGLHPYTATSQEYTVTDLGTLGGTTSFAGAINNYGHVAGEALAEGGVSYPFLYANGTMMNIGTNGDSIIGAGSQFNNAVAMDDSDTVAINAITFDFYSYALLWTNGQLQPVAGGEFNYVTAMNASDVAVGLAGYVPSIGGVIFSGPQAGFLDLGPYAEISPLGINNSGQIIAICAVQIASGPPGPACVITGNSKQMLVLLPGSSQATPHAIDVAGDICGVSSGGNLSSSTATYWKKGTPINLGTPPGSATSECLGMDDFGQGVGDTNSGSNTEFAVLFDPLHGARDLNLLIKSSVGANPFYVGSAIALSDTGYIAANCVYPTVKGGQIHACLLTPNRLLILKDNIFQLAKGDPECIQCITVLDPEANSLPETLVGLTLDQRERVVATVDLIGGQLEQLERARQISAPKAELLLHQAQLVIAALRQDVHSRS